MFCKKNSKVHSVTYHEGTDGEYRYRSTLSLTSMLDGREWSTPQPGHPWKRPSPHYTGG